MLRQHHSYLVRLFFIAFPILLLAQKEVETWMQLRDRLYKTAIEESEVIYEKNPVTPELVKEYILSAIRANLRTEEFGNFAVLKGTDWSGKDLELTAKLSLKEVADKVYADVEAKLRDLFSYDKAMAQASDEAEAKFAMYRVDQKVQVTKNIGNHRNEYVSGLFKGLMPKGNPDKVCIGSRYISRKDLAPEVEAKFFPEAHEKMKKEYIEKKEVLFKNSLEAKKYELLQEWMPAALLAAGFVPNPKEAGAKIQSHYPGRWICRGQLYRIIFDEVKLNEKARIGIKILEPLMEKHGFVFERNMKNEYEWMPKEVFEKIKAEKEWQEWLKNRCLRCDGRGKEYFRLESRPDVIYRFNCSGCAGSGLRYRR